jgi:hypothetical protein
VDKLQRKNDKEKIERMIRSTSHTIPSYLEVLKEADLNGAYLMGANLIDAKIKNVVVSEETKATGIVLVPKLAENKTSLRKALKAIDPSLRKRALTCFLISFNDYSTSYEKSDIRNGCINLVDIITKLVFPSGTSFHSFFLI